MLDDFQLNAVRLGSLGRAFSRIALVNLGQFHVFAGDLFYSLGQHADLSAILLIGRGDMQSKKMAQRVHRRVNLRSLRRLAPS